MNIDDLAYQIEQQANELFPNRTDSGMFLKIYHEVGELIDADTPAKKADEMADLMILLLDYAARHCISVGPAIINKMNVNQNRTWKTSALGVNQHVKD